MKSDCTVVHNTAERRYELDLKGDRAVLEYVELPGVLVLTHTGVPKRHEGRGIGSELVRAALEDIRDRGLRVVPQCRFVERWIRRHPEWEEIVAE
ncbi:MAG: N-acetyltransferase [Alistipes sp.]|nr:N-acetyltransferase [Alistipes sp.]